MSPELFRCEYDGKLVLKKQVLKGKCLGHRLKPASKGTFLEWIKVKYWKLKGDL